MGSCIDMGENVICIVWRIVELLLIIMAIIIIIAIITNNCYSHHAHAASKIHMQVETRIIS